MKHFLSGIAVTALLFGCQSASAAPAATSSNEFTVGASVDGQGSITQIQNGPEMPAPIVAVLQDALPHWRFVPVMRDGKPAAVHTFISARVEAVPTANHAFRVRVEFVGTGPMLLPGTPPMRFPTDAIRSREGGIVLVFYDMRPDGSHVVVDVQSKHGGRNDPLAKAMREWVQRTRSTPETVNGQPVAAHLTTYTRFSLVLASVNGMRLSGSSAPAPPPLDAEEKKFLASAGFTFDGGIEAPPVSESVLKPANTETVMLDP